MKLKNIVIFSVLFSISLSEGFAQESELDVDSLFEEAEDDKAVEEPDEGGNAGVLDLLKDDEKLKFGASFDATIGYSAGWQVDDAVEFSDTSLMLLSSKLTLDATINGNFRFLQSYNVAYPGFTPTVSEFFADFDISDRVFFRLGRQNLTWGISRYYKFTNLHARLPENFGSHFVLDENQTGSGKYIIDEQLYNLETVSADDIGNNDSLSMKIDVPLGIGGFQGLMYTRNGFFEDSSYPAIDEFGWGLTYNLAIKQFDFTLGGFYHKDMNLRGFYSFSTTLFNRLELYSEAVISYDQKNDDYLPYDEANLNGDGNYVLVKDTDRLDFGVNLGFYVDFFDGMLEFSGEYYYNGEETELEPLGTKLGVPLVWGHNLAGGFGASLLDGTLKIEAYTLYNISENSGALAPIITFKPLGYIELKAAFPLVYGAGDGPYMTDNPDKLGRRFSFVLSAKVSGKI